MHAWNNSQIKSSQFNAKRGIEKRETLKIHFGIWFRVMEAQYNLEEKNIVEIMFTCKFFTNIYQKTIYMSHWNWRAHVSVRVCGRIEKWYTLHRNRVECQCQCYCKRNEEKSEEIVHVCQNMFCVRNQAENIRCENMAQTLDFMTDTSFQSSLKNMTSRKVR